MDNEKYNPLPRDWREQLAGTREYLEEGKSLSVLIGSKRLRLLRDAFFWFQELSDQISTLRSAIRMFRSNSRLGYWPNSQQYLSYLLSKIHFEVQNFAESALYHELQKASCGTNRYTGKEYWPPSPFNGHFMLCWQAGWTEIAWLITLGKMQDCVHDMIGHDYRQTFHLERKEAMKVCEMLTTLGESIPYESCLLPTPLAVRGSASITKLPEGGFWRHWARHHLGHLGKGQHVADVLAYEEQIRWLVSGLFDVTHISVEGLSTKNSLETWRIRELRSRMSNMTIFHDSTSTVLLSIY